MHFENFLLIIFMTKTITMLIELNLSLEMNCIKSIADELMLSGSRLQSSCVKKQSAASMRMYEGCEFDLSECLITYLVLN